MKNVNNNKQKTDERCCHLNAFEIPFLHLTKLAVNDLSIIVDILKQKIQVQSIFAFKHKSMQTKKTVSITNAS